jgi:hypothetical protein
MLPAAIPPVIVFAVGAAFFWAVIGFQSSKEKRQQDILDCLDRVDGSVNNLGYLAGKLGKPQTAMKKKVK